MRQSIRSRKESSQQQDNAGWDRLGSPLSLRNTAKAVNSAQAIAK